MQKKLLAAMTVVGTFILLTGCVIVVNQPSPQEKELMNIQQQVSSKIAEMSQKVNPGGTRETNVNDVSTFLAQANQAVDEGIKAIDALKLPEKAQQAAEQTKQYFEKAKQTFAEIKALLSDINKLKSEGQKMTTEAQQTLKEKMKELDKNLSGFKSQLDVISNELIQTRDQILNLYSKTGWK